MSPTTVASDVLPYDLRRRIESAEAHASRCQSERDAAISALEKVKRDVAWTMHDLKIKDLIFNSDPIPTSAPGHVEQLFQDPDDSVRIAWLNANGRVCLGSECFLIGLPHGGDPSDEPLPTPYNIRHIIDICRKRFPDHA